MKNTVISQEELNNLQGVINAVEKYMKGHKSLDPLALMKANEVEKVHILLLTSMIGDLIKDVGAIKGVLDVSEEDFVRTLTEDGMTLKEVEMGLFKSMLMDMLS